MKRKGWIVFYCLVALAAACTKPLPPIAEPVGQLPPAEPSVTTAAETAPGPAVALPKEGPGIDEELFLKGVQELSDPAPNDDSGNARQSLQKVANEFPQSKWREAARVTLHLLEAQDRTRQQLASNQGEITRLMEKQKDVAKENEQLKKDLRLLNEKYQTDQATWQQENEQLKKDLQLLKKLEIQMDRREKLLR